MAGILTGLRTVLGSPFVQSSGKKDGGKQQTNQAALTARLKLLQPHKGFLPEVVQSSTIETESMKRFRPNVFRMNGRKSSHQLH
jgi:hypothetical protein